MPATPRKVFVNLPVEDVKRSIDFFTKLGFEFDPRFTEGNTACMNLSDDGFVMLLERERFSDFTKKEIAEASAQTEVIVALSADSREEVDELADKALASGGSAANDPHDEGFMYGRSFQDPDSHIWEVFWMDMDGMPE